MKKFFSRLAAGVVLLVASVSLTACSSSTAPKPTATPTGDRTAGTIIENPTDAAASYGFASILIPKDGKITLASKNLPETCSLSTSSFSNSVKKTLTLAQQRSQSDKGATAYLKSEGLSADDKLDIASVVANTGAYTQLSKLTFSTNKKTGEVVYRVFANGYGIKGVITCGTKVAVSAIDSTLLINLPAGSK